jgi:alkylation response protein AidB-like acyl-CoA dehydrogenase
MEFVDVHVPDSSLLGAPGEGLKTFLSTFNASRLGNASELIGLGRRALALGLDYARDRQVAGGVVADFQGIQWTIAECYAELYSASLVRDRAATEVAIRGEDIGFLTSLAKRAAIGAADLCANEAFSLVGGFGLYADKEFTGIQQDVKVLRTAGGSLEILKNYIAKSVIEQRMAAAL